MMTDQELDAIVDRYFNESERIAQAFFDKESERLAHACYQMARRFHHQGRIWTFGDGFWTTDAQHVAVEFVHPAIVGNKALPGISLSNNNALLTSPDSDMKYAYGLKRLAKSQDIALGFSTDGQTRSILQGLAQAKAMGMLTLGLSGAPGFKESSADFIFTVNSPDPLLIQETHELVCHVFYELVHVFLDQEVLL
ncbi:SIS domain-containing protein [Sulfobacillus thermosulfidooxidans]|uniref:SIS domain-containing protein n=1 Tax=Sulfobacillus thermosulfidooxidans TaxID=28034 RepID=UPI0006B43725|nr:SIS domain-containing protein [Sulfobacillus thermosulfidooxidans]